MLLGLSVALGIGLLVGAERERRKDSSPTRNAAGIRTFCISALLGAVSVLLGDGLITAVTALIVGAGALVTYQRTLDLDPGLTTEFALLYSMGERASRQESVMSGAVAGALFSSIATIIQMAVVIGMVQTSHYWLR